jgi:hypothetical protein
MITKLGGAAVLLMLATAAHASDIPTLTSVTASGANYQFNYQASLSADEGLVAGDKLAIIDFAGYVAGSVLSTNANWTASVSNSLPSGLSGQFGVTDNAAIPDLVFTYVGPTFQTSGGPYPNQVDYAGLSAVSTYGDSVFGYFSAVAIKNTGPTQGSIDYNTGSVGVPSGVPEPASWAMLILGLAGVGGVLRRERPRALAA